MTIGAQVFAKVSAARELYDEAREGLADCFMMTLHGAIEHRLSGCELAGVSLSLDMERGIKMLQVSVPVASGEEVCAVTVKIDEQKPLKEHLIVTVSHGIGLPVEQNVEIADRLTFETLVDQTLDHVMVPFGPDLAASRKSPAFS